MCNFVFNLLMDQPKLKGSGAPAKQNFVGSSITSPELGKMNNQSNPEAPEESDDPFKAK